MALQKIALNLAKGAVTRKVANENERPQPKLKVIDGGLSKKSENEEDLKKYAQNYTDQKRQRRLDRTAYNRRGSARPTMSPQPVGMGWRPAPNIGQVTVPNRSTNKALKIAKKLKGFYNLWIDYPLLVNATIFQLILWSAQAVFLVMAIVDPFRINPVGIIISGILEVLDMSPAMGLFMGMTVAMSALITVIFWALMFIYVIRFSLTGFKWWNGEKAAKKQALFMLAFVGYGLSLPTQWVPWLVFWVVCVNRNPN